MFTKTPEELQARRNRVKQMIASGDVMTSAKRAKLRKQQLEAQKLQDKADIVLAGLNAPVRRSNAPMGTSSPIVASVAPEANVSLSRTTKVDNLASAADAIIKELQGGN